MRVQRKWINFVSQLSSYMHWTLATSSFSHLLFLVNRLICFGYYKVNFQILSHRKLFLLTLSVTNQNGNSHSRSDCSRIKPLQDLFALRQQILLLLFAYEVLDQVERVQDRPALLFRSLYSKLADLLDSVNGLRPILVSLVLERTRLVNIIIDVREIVGHTRIAAVQTRNCSSGCLPVVQSSAIEQQVIS